MRKSKDISGETFGRLLVIGRTDKRLYRYVMWQCQCECGNIVNVATGPLKSGHTRSCGCLNAEKSKDLTGKKFGRLLVVRFSHKQQETKGTKVFWECLCECGNITYVTRANLQNGSTKSCGCLNKERLIERLTTHGLSRTKEYRAMKSRERAELKKLYDTNWTLAMELALKEFQQSCVVCGSQESLQVDHVNSLSKGFGLEPGNAVILCRSCNTRKNDRDLSELDPAEASIILEGANNFKMFWNQAEQNR